MTNKIVLTKDDVKKLDNILTDIIANNTTVITLESSSSIHTKDSPNKGDTKITLCIPQRIYDVIGEFKTVIRDDTDSNMVSYMTSDKIVLSIQDFNKIKHLLTLIPSETLTLECGEPNGIGDILTLTLPLDMKFSPENYEIQTVSGEFKITIRGVDEW
jgi:hypothetical protein